MLPDESFAAPVKFMTAGVEDVPVIAPVDGLTVSGAMLPVTEYVYGGLPPPATSAEANGVAVIPVDAGQTRVSGVGPGQEIAFRTGPVAGAGGWPGAGGGGGPG